MCTQHKLYIIQNTAQTKEYEEAQLYQIISRLSLEMLQYCDMLLSPFVACTIEFGIKRSFSPVYKKILSTINCGYQIVGMCVGSVLYCMSA